jgi:SWI/SNF related-matrix-associated actin-dependent regulator of chromatin subfamily C
MWYHCTRVPDFYLCAQHFAEGRFPGDTAAGDFVKHDGSALALALSASAPNSCAGRWTDSETLLLLEALTTSSGNSDDWGRIASHVGTKSKAQCLAHFLALPIQERFLDDMEGRPSAPAAVATALAAGAVGGEDVGAAPEEVRDAFAGPHLIPFQDAGNPIMAQCAFMAAVVGPRVAAAAAAAALAALEQEDSAAAGAVPMDTDGGPHFSAAAIRRSLAVCLAGGAVKAKMMADQEERDIHRTVVGVIDSQAKKVDAKMKLVLQLDNLLREETAAVVAAQAAALQGP